MYLLGNDRNIFHNSLPLRSRSECSLGDTAPSYPFHLWHEAGCELYQYDELYGKPDNRAPERASALGGMPKCIKNFGRQYLKRKEDTRHCTNAEVRHALSP
ncbi:hypothetical protein M404DRAFT_308512 [Pisolithus tinctorius Marx 270]|uniref:Uncharacterized protein n=1 Tax=Pisolithus tinctorius Marx 270 TaxID=870435 RepID=A0A0C3P747_PISTI|nr:hypothetical protein M404DRAFT_308512 [Pisolithus tinctorius Marx 270]